MTFEQVLGQTAAVKALRNQIEVGRIAHAYLFCGSRGTGKTTCAKILAKAVNCTNPKNGNPCNECESCRSIDLGIATDVIEMDAASNSRVEEIRELLEKVDYPPQFGKYKVYIIDEVHMLSAGAFNALLKTLEEPPSYVIFILATTEVHKIPITILSRCQRYDFRRITVEEIAGRLKELTTAEQLSVEDRALRYVATAADGSMRDAISLLDQCVAFYLGETLTYDKVLEVLGTVDVSIFGKLMAHIRTSNVTEALRLLDEIVVRGRELTQFTVDFTWYLRNLLLIHSSEGIEDIIDISSENMIRLKAEAQMTDTDTIMRYIRIFSELSGKIRYAAQKRILLEVALIKLCRPSMETDMESILGRLRELEKRMEKGVVAVPLREEDNGWQGEQMQQPHPSLPSLPQAVPEDIQLVVERWPSILAGLQQPMKTHLKNARLSLGNNNHLVIVVQDWQAADYLLKNEEHKGWLQRMISDAVQKEIEIEVQSIDEGNNFETSYIDLSKIIHMEIELEGD